MDRWMTVMLCLFLAGAAGAAQVQVIDDCEYPDAATAAAVWQTSLGGAPVELLPHASQGGKTAVKIPCRFTEDIERGSVDRRGRWNLLRVGSIAFDFYVDDPAPISYCSIYFHSGNGWYASQFDISRGWRHVVLDKGAFRIEGEPAGWGRVDTIRLSAWKGKAVDTYCAFDNLTARTEDLVVVRGLSPTGENETARRCAEQLGGYLRKLGLPCGILTDQDVEDGALQGRKMALFAYSPSLRPEAVAKIVDFVGAGGKIIVFFSIPPALQEILGVSRLTYVRQRQPGQFQRVVLNAPQVTGLPPAIEQDSWNVHVVQPGGHHARIIGRWQSADGRDFGPAVLLSDNGAYMGHILTNADPEDKQQFLLALLGHFLPGTWKTVARNAFTTAGRIGPYQTTADLLAFLQKEAADSPFAPKVDAALKDARNAETEARRLLAGNHYPQAVTAARKMHEALLEAYFVAHVSRRAEFRAVWNHSGTGDCGTWDEAMKRLKAANFNAVVPNMWWGGLARYKSKFLPQAKLVEEQGDQIAECVAAGKKYGIEVHPWKVNWNLANAPDSFVQRMRAQQRLQKDAQGREVKWLCPSNPANFQLELDTMLEVVRNYDVEGIHFDYIRYPGGNTCYCDGCRKRFETYRGKPVENWPEDCFSGPLKQEYRDWRCTNITRLVKAVSGQARKIKPYLKISAAVFSDYPNCRNTVGQDWVLWCREGYLDFVCPMNYTTSDTRLENLVTNQVSRVGAYVPVYSGIGAFINSDDRVVAQLELARSCGADGFILFNMGTALAKRTFPRLAEGITSAPALLPHSGPEVRFVTAYDQRDEPIQVQEETLPVTVELVSPGRHRKVVRSVTGTLELQDMTGKPLAQLGPLPAAGAKTVVRVTRQAGFVRVAAVGTLTFAGGSTQPFVTRSRPYGFAARAVAKK